MPVTENSSLLFSSCHLKLVIWKIFDCLLLTLKKQQAKNQIFSKITTSRWHKENNRLLFSVTGIRRWSGPLKYRKKSYGGILIYDPFSINKPFNSRLWFRSKDNTAYFIFTMFLHILIHLYFGLLRSHCAYIWCSNVKK